MILILTLMGNHYWTSCERLLV